MSKLMKEIERMINDEMLRTGRMGTESVTIEIELDEEQQKEFDELDLNEHYDFEREDNKIFITYTEEV